MHSWTYSNSNLFLLFNHAYGYESLCINMSGSFQFETAQTYLQMMEKADAV